MNFNKLNVSTGWLIWLVATVVYLLTIEPTASFWDCGEFIASANGLEVGHPPGAPFWMLLARLFIIFAPEGFEATSVNMLSALSSSFTILFLFWSITHMAKKLAERKGDLTTGKMIAVIGSGAVGALVYTFSDSFWFSAVEGEVYALSSLFTALVFWAILKWETLSSKEGSELRWIILIAYLMGLSIGVHLLNLLAIPAIAFVYYFKRYEVTRKGIIITLLISMGILGLVQVGIIAGLVSLAAKFELLFVNGMGMPFNSGVLIYVILILALATFLLWYTRKRGWVGLNTLTLGSLVCILGYSTFALIVIRSLANTPMDENNPDNLYALLSYLNREQYGDRPLLYGQYFNTPTEIGNDYKDGDPSYISSYSIYKDGKKGPQRIFSHRQKFLAENYLSESSEKGLYIVQEYLDSKEKEGAVPNYDSNYCGFLPRMYSRQDNHIREYKYWSNYKGWNEPSKKEKVKQDEAKLREVEGNLQQLSNYIAQAQAQGVQLPQDLETEYRALLKRRVRLFEKLTPTFGEDKRYFFTYQVGWMYWRYFMWNFAGKQNDTQGHGDIIDGNWLSGINMIDAERLGNRDRLPESVTRNKGFNKLFYLPLLLGLIGMIFHLMKSPKDFTVVSLLFVLTGFAVLVYLNQYPMQPRERDYAYVGSFYAFTIWIGLGLYALYDAYESMSFKDLGTLAMMLLGGSVFIWLLEFMFDADKSFSLTLFYLSIITLILHGIMVGLRHIRQSGTVGGAVALILCMIVPMIMAAEGWDDHSRAKRKTGVDFAKNYMDTLEPNSIIFTNGDNDTFPLWYVQEVEGYRTDVRIVNLSLLNTDWYIDQMKKKAYNSDPVPFSMPEIKYRQGTRDYVYLDNNLNRNDTYIDLQRAMDICLDDSKGLDVGSGKKIYYLPSNKFSLPVDSATVVNNGTVSPENAGKIVDEIEWTIVDAGGKPKQVIYKNSLLVLDMLLENNWKRPIYFAVTTGMDAYMGLMDYFQLEGLAYRLVPIKAEKTRNPNVLGGIATDIMYDNVMNKFQWGNMDDTTGVYMDENNRRMTTNLRLQFSNLAEQMIREGKEDKARNVLNKCLEVMPDVNVPFDRVMLPVIESYFAIGQTDSLQVDSAATLSNEEREATMKTGMELAERLFEIFEDDAEYFLSLEPQFAAQWIDDISLKLSVNNRLGRLFDFYAPDDPRTVALKERQQRLEEEFEAKVEEIQAKRIGPLSF